MSEPWIVPLIPDERLLTSTTPTLVMAIYQPSGSCISWAGEAAHACTIRLPRDCADASSHNSSTIKFYVLIEVPTKMMLFPFKRVVDVLLVTGEGPMMLDYSAMDMPGIHTTPK
ncbi:unnamed protein product [Pleuronectes platessa]|uniref:Uncharacterized protein n=1 Tax=Pleuronectes platessa TaxID=8262 RepID=A0A9N7VNS3_PLEPL|nr:unnamed protein product [Pleuronectes platessa]